MKSMCERCGQKVKAEIEKVNSVFELGTYICPPCKLEEMKHLQYHEAVQAKFKAMREHDLDFTGLGLPEDLKPKK